MVKGWTVRSVDDGIRQPERYKLDQRGKTNIPSSIWGEATRDHSSHYGQREKKIRPHRQGGVRQEGAKKSQPRRTGACERGNPEGPGPHRRSTHGKKRSASREVQCAGQFGGARELTGREGGGGNPRKVRPKPRMTGGQ